MKKALYLSLCLATFSNAFAQSDYFWVGGTGNWSDFANHWATTSGGAMFHTQVPSSLDDVYFDANSFSTSGQVVTINTNANCLSMDWTGVTNFPSFVSIGNNIMNVYGSLTFSSDMTAAFKVLEFESSNAGNTITTNGILFDPLSIVRFYGGGEWTFQDNFNAGTISLFSGSLNTNSNNIDLGTAFEMLGGDSKTITLGASTINTKSWRTNGTNITINAGASKINVVAAFYADQLGDGPFTYHDVEFTAETIGALRNTGTYNEISLAEGMELILESGATHTINNLNVAGSKHKPIIIHSDMDGMEATFNKPSGTINIFYVEMMDVHATGGATFTANNAIDNGNNNGWTINTITGEDYFWVGNSGSWTDFSSHWATSSGGATMHTDYPGKNDDVYFDANSFSSNAQTVTNDLTIAQFHNMDWTGVTNNPTFNSTLSHSLHAYGSVTFASNMTRHFGQLHFRGDGSFTDLGTGSPGTVTFNTTGTYNLLSDITVSTWRHYLGTVNYNNVNVICNVDFEIGTAGTSPIINLQSSSITCRDFKVFVTLTPTLDAGTSHITVKRNLNGYGISLHEVTMNGNTSIVGSNTFEYLNVVPGSSVTFQNGETQTVNQSINLEGTKADPISLNSSSSGMQSTISKTSGTVDATYLILQDMVAAGGATFTATQTIDNGNNTGWNITGLMGEDYYWVGNSGNWSDFGSHWATTSGGSVFHTTAPGVLDNALFDENSFDTNGETVTVDIAQANTHDLIAAATVQDFTISGPGKKINVYGSIDLPSAFNSTVGTYNFLSTSAETLDFHGGSNESSDIIFSSSGTWDLLSGINPKKITMQSGTLNTNDHSITVTGAVEFTGTNAKVFNLGSSSAYATHWSANLAENVSLNGASSQISVAGNFNLYTSGTNNIALNEVTFTSGPNEEEGFLYGNIIVNSFTLEAGKVLKHVGSASITTNAFVAVGDELNPIIIAPQTGNILTIVQPSGVVDAYYLELEYVTATGGATFNAYNSINNGNVSGWIFHKADQSINFTSISDKVFGDSDFALEATASSGLGVTFSILSGPATVTGNMISITGVGIVQVKAEQPGNIDYNPAPSITLFFEVLKANQVITFNALANKIVGDLGFSLTAVASSGLDVSYSSSNLLVASVSGNTVSIIGEGTTTITASQAGNDNYNEAPDVMQDLVVEVAKQPQTITFDALADKTFGDAPFNLNALASSGLTVNYMSSNADVATLSGNTVTIIGAGTTTITASQPGDENFSAADPVNQILTVNKASQEISFDPIEPQLLENGSYALSASSSSGLVVSFEIVSGPATLDGVVLSFTASGDIGVRAMQLGNANYNAATPVDQTFSVTTITATETDEPDAVIRYYPNPTTDYLNIDLSSFEYSKIELISQTGKVVKTVNLNSATATQLDVHSLDPGLYLLLITNKEERYVFRIIKN